MDWYFWVGHGSPTINEAREALYAALPELLRAWVKCEANE
jgi:hypothetical protein